jgi:hypothetical protein
MFIDSVLSNMVYSLLQLAMLNVAAVEERGEVIYKGVYDERTQLTRSCRSSSKMESRSISSHIQ